ncbi:MAG: GntR family transcriptional regulator [Bosea sp.]|uniref:GntR family transcriptional regulator n=1 Tax=unclassified Bosea (in: a-proteobacteria) TaxID=2653178 RepID=UPI000B173736|nr:MULTISPECIES: GntR family transcriptional regulator [unclassified Bosea (in: a-proteobacteria)]MBN9458061.1 GntR family transcriptional regulator [Bosea sp. (in: a-proteobacteria)]
MTPKLSRPSDLVYGIVKRRIILNELTPETVLTELGLAREIGCSQGPIREALLHLQEDGLVVRSGRRTIVTRLTAEEADEMLALRRRIETRGALKAALNADGSALDDLHGILAAMKEAATEGDEYRVIEADKDFHLALFRLSGLDALGQILARCIMHSNRYKLWAPEHRRPLIETARRHDVLFERLAAGDGSGLAKALGGHIDTIVIQGGDEVAA